MILKYPQQCFKLYSNVNCVQATHLNKQFGALSYSKAYYKVPLDKDARYSPDLLQVCSQCIVPFSSKRHKSHKVPNSGKFGGGGKSAYIYAKKFLCGGMVGPKLPWMTITGQPQAKKIVPSKGGNTTSKRLTVLDQVFFDAVTDLMASGELGDRLAGRGLVITKVRVQDGLIGMQVFWSLNSGDLSCQSLASEVSKSGKPVKESVEEQSIEDLLSWAAPILRQELANLRVVGCTVPHVNFKPDMSVHNSLEVDRILLKVREELQDADDRADEAAKKERELLLGQQRRLEVPDRIFAPDFVYRPVYYDAANLPTYSGKKSLSRFTPFAPRGKGLRVESKTQVDDRAETDARLNGFPEDNDNISAVSSVEESAPAENSVIRVRKSTPQHGILLQNNVYGINRDRIMEKIAGCIGRMKEYTSVTNADLRFPFALTLRLPSGEPETNENAVEHFESKKSLQNWAYKYSKKTSRNDSDEKNFLLRKSAKEARRISMEQESLKYDAFEEEIFKYTDEEDHWDEREDKE